MDQDRMFQKETYSKGQCPGGAIWTEPSNVQNVQKKGTLPLLALLVTHCSAVFEKKLTLRGGGGYISSQYRLRPTQ